ncbi:hypothetical protein Tsubulata_024179 [Turnera subulata]|uniref:Uncharacterized protein n=1 Tax=Turnera subulata TaxID=218843 RepID=A0A9Q0FZP6_9ROSI|nr:hypothetical protein Tsubulata_024179 [Turnera subulata]
MSDDCEGKSSWPELLGARAEDAVKVIEEENPYVGAVLVPEGSVVTADFRCDRVRVWFDKHGIVISVPRIG